MMFDDEKDDNNTQIIRETPTKKRKKSSNNKHNITLCGAALAHNVIRKHSELAQALIKHTLNYSQQPFHINMFQTIRLTGQVWPRLNYYTKSPTNFVKYIRFQISH